MSRNINNHGRYDQAQVHKHQTKVHSCRYNTELKHDHKVQVKYGKAWRSRENDIDKVRCKASEYYAELSSYLGMLHCTNP